MWYYVRDGQQEGPVSEEQLRIMAQTGELRRETLVWQDGMSDWQPAADVLRGAFGPATPPAPAAPPPPQYVAPPRYVPPPQYPAPPQYGAPAPQYGMPQPGYAGADIPNHLPWAIVVTVLCCLPMGIAAIVFASKANSAKQRGDWVEARKAADQARLWIILSVVLGLLWALFIVAANTGNVLNNM